MQERLIWSLPSLYHDLPEILLTVSPWYGSWLIGETKSVCSLRAKVFSLWMRKAPCRSLFWPVWRRKNRIFEVAAWRFLFRSGLMAAYHWRPSSSVIPMIKRGISSSIQTRRQPLSWYSICTCMDIPLPKSPRLLRDSAGKPTLVTASGQRVLLYRF